jgi:ERCC4-type nuclease
MNSVAVKKLSLQVHPCVRNRDVLEELGKYPNVFHCEINPLKTGSYLLQRQILIERKRLLAFLKDIKSGDLFQHAHRMAHSGYLPLIILEGNKSDMMHTRMKREAIQGAMIHLTVFMGIPILRSVGPAETARLIRYTGMQLTAKHQAKRNRSFIKHSEMKLNPSQQDGMGVLMSIPGIGCEKALSIMDRYCNLREIFNAELDELQEIRGIGPKLAENIYQLITKSFSNKKMPAAGSL